MVTDYDPGYNMAGYDIPSWPEQLSRNDVFTGTMNQYTWRGPVGDNGSINDPYPYMNYNDNPARPRMQMWFGPYSMMAFLMCRSESWNMNAATLHEARDLAVESGYTIEPGRYSQ